MPTRPTAPVNGARSTASARLTNGRGSRPCVRRPQRRSVRALDAVENGSHCDSPEANGGLLALTGLMLEQERELSGAVVGGAARQQDPGEQSPIAATEIERRVSRTRASSRP